MGIIRSSSLKEDSHSKFHAITGSSHPSATWHCQVSGRAEERCSDSHRHGSLINIRKPASPTPNERPAASTRARILSITCA